MTVGSNLNESAFLGDGVLDVFTFNFDCGPGGNRVSTDEIAVYLIDATTGVPVKQTGYSVAFNPTSVGGTVTLGSVPADGITGVIRRELNFLQTQAFNLSANLDERAIEKMGDRATFELQDILQRSQRGIQMPFGTTDDFNGQMQGTAIAGSSPRALLDGDGQVIGYQHSAYDVDVLGTEFEEAAGAAGSAAASAAAAAASALAAEQAAGNVPTLDIETTFLNDIPAFVAARGTDTASVVQALINAVATSGSHRFIYPSGDTYQGDVVTGNRTIIFEGQGAGFTRIIPTAAITRASFQLDGPRCAVKHLTIDDDPNTFADAAWTPDITSTKAGVLVGFGANTVARNCLIDNVEYNHNRGQGTRWMGGSFLTQQNVTYGQTGGIGWYTDDTSTGDTNHWEALNVSFTGCFGGSIKGGGSGNAFSAGFMAKLKSYNAGQFGVYIGGSGNAGSLFVEGSNTYRNTMTTTSGSATVSVPLINMANLVVGMVSSSSAAAGIPNNTRITAVNLAARTITLSANATASGTATFTFFTQNGMRVPSLWTGSNAANNMLALTGDSLDPLCYRDDGVGARNTINLPFSNAGNFIYDNSAFKFRLFKPNTRNEGDPNNALVFSTLVTTTSGSADIVLQDTTVLNRLRNGATMNSIGNLFLGGNTTISSVDQGTNTITMATTATASGTFLAGFSPNQRGGLLMKVVDDNVILKASASTNVVQSEVELGRGALFIGCTTSGSADITNVKRFDDENELVANSRGIWCTDNTIIADGGTISSFTGNDTAGYTITMSQAASATRTGVVFWMGNIPSGVAPFFRHIWPYLNQAADNAAATSANFRLGEVYRTAQGFMKNVVPAANDGFYTITWDPGSIANGAQASVGAFTADTNSKALVNVALGDLVEVGANRDLAGLHAWVNITTTNTMNLFLSNMTGGAVDLASTTFFIQHKQR